VKFEAWVWHHTMTHMVLVISGDNIDYHVTGDVQWNFVPQ